ncbi:MAG: Ribulose-5-phosphate 4-epimerase and related epimerase and aldolase [Acidimicrobiales bacterium]|nr:Ribulose-5-phosphate 4-epimerase and related epimerase and aldolase [Acidimicrobiales bacterium]
MASLRIPKKPFVERSPSDERLHRKQKLAAGFRIFGRLGFDEGVAGHITARDPERDDHFWVNPFGMSFKHVTVDDLILVNHEGEVVEGTWPVNQAAFCIHSQIHQARPDVVAAAHSHSRFGRAYSTLGRELEPLTQDSCIFFEDHALFDDFGGVVLDIEEGKRIAHALGGRKAAILKNHGILTVGHSVEETVFWYVTMERTCEVELIARSAGPVQPIPEEMARLTAGQVGSHVAGWFSGQPLFDWIEQLEPDLFGSTTPLPV